MAALTRPSRSGPSPRPRRDAVRNRRALTQAATRAFRAQGLDATVDDIARRAGVGVATLYRHFPTKLDLVVAVLDAVLADLGRAVDEALALGERRGDVLRSFLAAAMDQQRENRAFLEAITHQGLPAAARADLAERVAALLAPVVAAAHATGTLAPALGADDVLGAVRMLGAAGSPGATARPADPARALAVVLGGLAAPAAPADS